MKIKLIIVLLLMGLFVNAQTPDVLIKQVRENQIR